MNWRRGLFRVWLFFTIPWLVIVMGMVSHDTETREVRDATPAECAADPNKFECLYVKLEQVDVWRMPNWYVIAYVVGFPAVMFMVGASVFWVARGFTAPK